MKVKLKNGQVANLEFRMAQRYIRLGIASIYIEEKKPEIEEIKPKRKTKKKIEENEATITEGQECSPEEIQGW